jgi:CBS domain-containing protein
MRVRDVMTRAVETVSSEASLMRAAQKMDRLNIGFLPVVENHKVVGVITDRDLAVRGLGEGRSPRFTIVKEIMTPEVLWCHQDEVLTEAAKLMENDHVRRLVVLDDQKKLAGLLSLDDLAAHMSSDRLLGTVLRNVTLVT